MAQKRSEDLKKGLFESLRPHLAAEGFKPRVSENDFIRRQDGCSHRFCLSFSEGDPGYEILPWVAVRIDRVEDLFHQTSGWDPKTRRNTSTISSHVADLIAGSKWDGVLLLPSQSALASVSAKLVEMFQRIAELYF